MARLENSMKQEDEEDVKDHIEEEAQLAWDKL